MFDRIAGVYDLMNSVMTAGLHHRWRARAADLAEVGPGDRVLDVATGTGDLAIELAKRVAPGGEVIGSDFSEGMLERAREKAPDARAGSTGERARRCPTTTASSTPRPSASARATSRDLERGIGEMARVVRARRQGRRPRDHDADEAAAVDVLLACGSTASSRSSARSPATRDAYSYLPSSVRRFPGPRGARRGADGAGLHRRPLDPHRRRDHRAARRDRTRHVTSTRRGRRPDRRGRGAARSRALLARRRGAPAPSWRAGTARSLADARRRDDRRRRQAAAAAARAARRPGRRDDDARGVVRAARRGRARAQRDAGPRRRARRAPTLRRGRPTVVGVGRARHGDRDRRPAVRARVRRAGRRRPRRAVRALSRATLGARRGRAAPARGRVERRRDASSATCSAAS